MGVGTSLVTPTSKGVIGTDRGRIRGGRYGDGNIVADHDIEGITRTGMPITVIGHHVYVGGGLLHGDIPGPDAVAERPRVRWRDTDRVSGRGSADDDVI